ncbi:tol-pal system protein YbgF [Poseidonocella sedimentorum]|uniref:Cell division coordinator CpoB n=1 Tax=Poseidonocella sedimentorum TaxID=871652 RepID=A0A1I6EG08_9RHOB|nr:tol-pal system protein YbgF [Poseidonocella sedimentorum]SFR16468.1 tol-pal system protein YbgF [Poseidonocella sedimentorum]
MGRAGPLFGLLLGLMPLGASLAQEREATLADIRQELSVLYVEIQRLQRELSTTAAPDGIAPQEGVLARVDAIEGALQALTGKTEELEFRINRVVTDGTTRIGDLDYRLCELEPSCDPATLGQTPRLGGAVETPAPDPAPTPEADAGLAGFELAVGEEKEFTQAQAALEAGAYAAAAEGFARFNEAYPGSPLGLRALMGQGEALTRLEDHRGAARAYLDAFSTEPASPEAPQALLRLGQSLGALGQTDEACLTLAEVGTRFPDRAEAAEAAGERARLGCS